MLRMRKRNWHTRYAGYPSVRRGSVGRNGIVIVCRMQVMVLGSPQNVLVGRLPRLGPAFVDARADIITILIQAISILKKY
jgi:hypothetical protein